MKNYRLFLFVFLLLSIAACKDDDDDCLEEKTCIEPIEYKNYEVDFYSTHKDFVVIPATFETVTEQVLIKPAHQQGALFETVTETLLVKESYSIHRILDSMNIHVVANSETDSIAEVTCYNFFEPADFQQIIVPAEYQTLVKQNLIQQGTGAEVPAEYKTITRQILDTPAQILATDDEQIFQKIIFTVQEDRTIRDYLANQFAQQGIVECEEGNSYKIWD